MNHNSQEQPDDSPEDITSVDLTIRAVSGNISPVIYANGRNQLPVEIIAKAMKLDPVTRNNRVLKFSQETWLHILNLRYAESDEKLTWQGSKAWCYTHTKNDYTREVINSGSITEPRYMEPGDELVTLYVYTDDSNIKRIAVSIDTDGGKHFTTADNASGAEKCSVPVRAISPQIYRTSDLLQDTVTNLGVTQVLCHYSSEDTKWSKKIDAHYDNYYFSVSRKIMNYTISHDAKADDRFPQRCAIYWRDDNHDQHILIENPSDTQSERVTLGFNGKAQWQEALSISRSTGIYDLFQTSQFNERPTTVCWTHLVFSASQSWIIPDGTELHVNDTDLYNFDTKPWFEFYDLYGNYGAFNIRYNSAVKKLEVDQR